MLFDVATTNRYSSLDEAQRDGIGEIASAIAQVVRAGLESGRFSVTDGFVFPVEKTTIPSILDLSSGES